MPVPKGRSKELSRLYETERMDKMTKIEPDAQAINHVLCLIDERIAEIRNWHRQGIASSVSAELLAACYNIQWWLESVMKDAADKEHDVSQSKKECEPVLEA